MSGCTRLWNGAGAVQGEWCSADVNSGSFLHCSVPESKSMFCFQNESNQKMNQYGWRCFTDVRGYVCTFIWFYRFYISVKINFQYRKKKNNIWFPDLFKMCVCEHGMQNLRGVMLFKYKLLYLVFDVMWRTCRRL